MSESLLRQLSAEMVDLARRVVPSTAIISAQTKDFGRTFGSAWVFRDQYLVTNHHVVDGVEPPIFARLPGYARLRVTVHGTDPQTDLAVLILERAVAPALAVRDQPAQLGELCFAFGSPLGEFPESVTHGVVSGLHRRLTSPGGRTIENALQTDATINHGNSGGPLVDVEGNVIGVNSQGIENADNLGFAIAADTVRMIASELIEFGTIERASLGISLGVIEVGDESGSQERMTVTVVRAEGSATLAPGDVLMRIDGTDVKTRGDLFRLLDRTRIDADLKIDVLRADQPTSVVVHALRRDPAPPAETPS